MHFIYCIFSYSFGKLIRLKKRREKLTLGMQFHRFVNKWETAGYFVREEGEE